MTTPTAALAPDHTARIVEAAVVMVSREPLEVSDSEDSNSAWCIYCRSHDNDGVYNDETEDIDFAVKHSETCPWALLFEAIGPA
jgi:hypothetical protein